MARRITISFGSKGVDEELLEFLDKEAAVLGPSKYIKMLIEEKKNSKESSRNEKNNSD